MTTTVSQRVLNRTLLERQLLLERTSRPPLEVIRHLIAVQGQEPNWPFVGLAARITDFRHDDLESLVRDRRVVRSTMIRRTMHLAAVEDYAWLRPTVEPIVRAALGHPFYATEIEGIDHAELAKVGRELLRGRTLPRRELGRLLGERYPGRHQGRLTDSVEIMEPLVHGPDTAAWGSWRSRTGIEVTRAEDWTGAPMAAADPETMILRYLAAFGPASVMDVQAWAGITRLREVIDGLDLRTYRNEHGKVLYDLPDAELADPDRAAPVRFLPAFDNALLGHKDRTRVIDEEDRKRGAARASGGIPMFLVDGRVEGEWSVRDGELIITPFRPLADADAVQAEAARLLTFIAPESAEWTVRLEPGGGRQPAPGGGR